MSEYQPPAFNPHDPAEVEEWARTRLGVTEAVHLTAIADIYDRWQQHQEHSVAVADEMIAGRADIVLVINSTVDGREERYIASVSKSDPHICFRRQRLHTEELRALSPLALGTLVSDENFGSSKDGWNHGEYLNGGGSNYPHFWHKKLKEASGRITYAKAEDFQKQVAVYLREIRPGDGLYKLPEERRDAYEAIEKHARRVSRFHFRKAVRTFVGQLDPGALKAMWKAKYFDSMAYGWLTGRQPEERQSFFEKAAPKINIASKEAQKARQQALSALPILVYPMASWGREGYEMTKVVDRGGTLREALDTLFPKRPGVFSKEMIGWLVGKTHRFVDGPKGRINPRFYHFWQELPWLSQLPREWRPRNHKEMDTLCRIQNEIEPYARLTGRKPDVLLREFLTALRNPRGLPEGFADEAKKQGLEFRAFLKHIQKSDRIEIKSAMEDFFADVANKIIVPEVLRAAEAAGRSDAEIVNDDDFMSTNPNDMRYFTPGLLRSVFNDLSVIKVCSLSDRWHKHTNRLRVRTGKYGKTAVWGAAFAPMNLPGGVSAKCLTSSFELAEEGERMKHCVGGYTHQCVIGGDQIISLRAEDGSWSTTLQLHERREGDKRWYVAGQHEATDRRTGDKLPMAARDAPHKVQKYLEKNAPDWAYLDAMRAPYLKDALLLKIGFDYKDEKACDDAYAAWHGTFRDLFPEPTRQDFLKRTGIAAAIAKKFSIR